MNARALLSAWIKPAAVGRVPRPRRAWHLDLAVAAAPAAGRRDSDGGDGFDGNWYESSRALASGLRVIEHADVRCALARQPAPP